MSYLLMIKYKNSVMEFINFKTLADCLQSVRDFLLMEEVDNVYILKTEDLPDES